MAAAAVKTCAGLPASCSAIWIFVSKMGGWPDQLGPVIEDRRFEGLAVGRRTVDASGGKSVAALLSANGAQYPSLGRTGSPASLLAGAGSPRYPIPKPPRAEG